MVDRHSGGHAAHSSEEVETKREGIRGKAYASKIVSHWPHHPARYHSHLILLNRLL